jgi:DNA repair protein RecN (Recombination protein N)
MLLEIHLKNYTIIDSLTVDFTSGLNIITGETGTGKSVIVDAVNILLGDKVSTDLIKSGSEEAEIEALFDIKNNKILSKLLEKSGITQNDGLLLIKRTISNTGRGKVFINGSISTLNILGNVTEDLVDIFSQHEHQSLLKPANHIKYLDIFSDNSPLFEEYKIIYFEYLYINKKLGELSATNQDHTDKQEFLAYQLKEISDVNLLLNEDEELIEEEKILSNYEKINNNLSNSYQLLYDTENSAYNNIKNAVRELNETSKIDSNLEELANSINTILVEIEENAFSIRDYLSKMSFNPFRLEEINERLSVINSLKRKYGPNIKDILEKKEKLEEDLDNVINNEDKLNQLEAEKESVYKKLDFIANELSLKRIKCAEDLEHYFVRESENVGLKGSVLKVKIDQKEISPDGIDKITLLFSANPGENPKELNKVASGGELSRIMLLLKEIISKKDIGSILIFDEPESGIGGITAETIGKKIKNLSKNNQVICITHLPQVAKFAKSHYKVNKEIIGNSTTVTIGRLGSNEKIEEIGRMISGENITEKTLEAAREMLTNS